MSDNALATWLRQHGGADGTAAEPEAPWDLDEPHPSRRRLLLLVALPWLIALALGVAFLGRDAPAAVPAAPSEAAATEAPAAPAPVLPASGEDQELGQAGALLVRGALSGQAGGGGASRYVDGAVATDVRPVGEAWLVTVLALVLEGGEGGWEGVAVERYGVALLASPSGPVAVAGPWTLPPPAHPPPAPAPPVEDPALREQAAAALAAAGYRELSALDLTRDPALPGVLVARFDALPPGSGTAGSWTAWLEDAPEPSLLGGTR